MNKPILYYVHDPMCSWCWGYLPTWTSLEAELAGLVEIKYLVGGLAPDNNEVMAEDMQLFLQQTWQRIHQQLGGEFNFDFWRLCKPKRSTYPACRAILVARQQGVEREMLNAIQRAYYLNAQNPSEISTLAGLADSVGIDQMDFIEQMHSADIEQQLLSEIQFARSLPINGFPSLVLYQEGAYQAVALDYQQWQVTKAQIKKLLN